jgi:putative membrane protein
MRALIAGALVAAPLAAHEGRPLEPHDLALAWQWDPFIVAGLLVSALLYFVGSRRAYGLSTWEKRSYWAGWVALVIALISPLHPMGEVLFSAHMAQHELMMVIAAPMLVLGRPLVAYAWALPRPLRRPAIQPLSSLAQPLPAFLLHSIAIWAWHIPAAYDASVRSNMVHAAQHLSFLLTAILFWYVAIRQHVGRKHFGAGLFYIFATATHTAILGAILTLAQSNWYPVYEPLTRAWGLTPLEDQQLGGLIMWIPPAFAYLAAFLWIFLLWIRDADVRHPARVLSSLILVAVALGSASCININTPDPEFTAQELVRGGDPKLGMQYIRAYGCGSCHTIPGVQGAYANVGPPLTKVGMRTYLAGRIVNTPENMMRWIHNPKTVDDKTAMPVTGITLQEAWHVTAYLYTLK